MVWTGKVLACKTMEGKDFVLTFYSAGNKWEALDPKALFSPDQGTFIDRVVARLPVTGCFDNNQEILMLNAQVSAINKDENKYGTGQIIRGDAFEWTCTTAE